MKLTTKQLVFLAFLVSLNIVLTRFSVIYVAGSRISFTFIATAIMAVYFGPVMTGIGCGVADIIGATLFPAGAFFPGYTLSAIVTGVIYGLFLYNKRFSWWRILVIELILLVVITMGLNTLWATMTTGKGYLALLPPRVMTAMVRIPIEIAVLGVLQRYITPQLRRHLIFE